MTHQDLKILLDFHYWALDRVLEAAAALPSDQYTRDLGSSFKSVRETVTHIYAAEWAWYERWQGRSPTALLPPDQFPDLAALRHTWTELETQMRDFVASLGEHGAGRVIDYKLLSGQTGASPIWQMLQHVVKHASYHRGQVTTMLRQMGAQPAKPMDMIAYYRVTSEARS